MHHCKIKTPKPIKVVFYSQSSLSLMTWYIKTFDIVCTRWLKWGTKDYIHAAIEVNDFSFHVFGSKHHWMHRTRADRVLGTPYAEVEVGDTYYPMDFIMGYTHNFPRKWFALRQWIWFIGFMLVYICTLGFIKRPLMPKVDCVSITARTLHQMIDDYPLHNSSLPSQLYEDLIRHGAYLIIE